MFNLLLHIICTTCLYLVPLTDCYFFVFQVRLWGRISKVAVYRTVNRVSKTCEEGEEAGEVKVSVMCVAVNKQSK